MKIAYLILAHDSPNHLHRQIQSLLSPRAVFFIHLDRKSNFQDFEHIKGSCVHFVKPRIPVYWGDYSMVEATLILMRTALENSSDINRLVLLSGADYPIRSLYEIENYFIEHSDSEFINLIAMPSELAGKPISMLANYCYRPQQNYLLQKFRKAMVRLHIVPRLRDYRHFLGVLQPYGGSTWWALTAAAVKYVVQFAKDDKKVTQFFKHTQNPDETFIHTIIANSKFRSKVVGGVTFIDWSNGGPNPAYITHEHVKKFIDTDNTLIAKDYFGTRKFFFARKFRDDSIELTQKLDASFNK